MIKNVRLKVDEVTKQTVCSNCGHVKTAKENGTRCPRCGFKIEK